MASNRMSLDLPPKVEPKRQVSRRWAWGLGPPAAVGPGAWGRPPRGPGRPRREGHRRRHRGARGGQDWGAGRGGEITHDQTCKYKEREKNVRKPPKQKIHVFLTMYFNKFTPKRK